MLFHHDDSAVEQVSELPLVCYQSIQGPYSIQPKIESKERRNSWYGFQCSYQWPLPNRRDASSTAIVAKLSSTAPPATIANAIGAVDAGTATTTEVPSLTVAKDNKPLPLGSVNSTTVTAKSIGGNIGSGIDITSEVPAEATSPFIAKSASPTGLEDPTTLPRVAATDSLGNGGSGIDSTIEASARTKSAFIPKGAPNTGIGGSTKPATVPAIDSTIPHHDAPAVAEDGLASAVTVDCPLVRKPGLHHLSET